MHQRFMLSKFGFLHLLLLLDLLVDARVVNIFQRGSTLSESCRCAPGDTCFPSTETWAELNTSVSGRLVNVVSSAAFCGSLSVSGCTESQWESSVFRAGIPGAMNQVGPSIYIYIVVLLITLSAT